MTNRRPRQPVGRALVGLGLAGLALTACTSATIGTSGFVSTSSPIPSNSGTHSSPTPAVTKTVAPWPGAHQPPAGFPWQHVPGSAYLAVAVLDHGAVSLLWMDTAHLRLRYVPGSNYPEGSPKSAADLNRNTWIPKMVAAFDSGFKLHDNVGGYYYLSTMVSPMRAGYATILLSKTGVLRIGVWGSDIASVGRSLMVRQNLPPLVLHGVAQTRPTDTYLTWGFTFNHRWLVNRSALGQRADGTLVFAYGYKVRPVTIANYLVAAGSQIAIDLDMNGYFPAGYTYQRVGSQVKGTKINVNVVHPPTIYFHIYQKDFFSVQSL